jgi:hypothetical protein
MAQPWMPQEESDLDYQRVERRRQMANMLMGDAMSQIQNTNQGGMYASTISPFQGAQKLLAGYLAGKGMSNADKEQRNVLRDRNIKLAEALGDVQRGPQRNAPGGITVPQDPGAIVQQPRQEFQDGPIVKPFNPNIPQGKPDMPNDLATALRTPGAIEPNPLVFGPATGDMPRDIVPPVGVTPQTERPETAAEFAARVRIAASTRGINPLALFQSPEIAGRYQQMLEMEKEQRGFEREMDKFAQKDQLDRKTKEFERGLAANDIKDTITAKDGTIYGRKVDGTLVKIGDAGADMNQLMIPDGKGGWIVNERLAGARKEIGAASRPSIDVKVDTAGNSEVAKKVAGVAGGRLEQSLNQAGGGAGLISTIHGIREALDTGKVIMGPGATVRQYIGQIGQTLGVTGKNQAEILANTRKAMQGLAQSELDTAQQMKGQGQITEAERAIIRRAALGQIETMTEPELRLLLDVMEKTARYKIASHNAYVQSNIEGKPGMDLSGPMLKIPMPGEYQKRAPEASVTAPAKPGSVMRFDAQGNLIP